jgi:hypothetical protein
MVAVLYLKQAAGILDSKQLLILDENESLAALWHKTCLNSKKYQNSK